MLMVCLAKDMHKGSNKVIEIVLLSSCSLSADHLVISRFGHGSVHSKLISLILSVSILFTPVGPVFAAFGDGSPTVPNSSVFGTPTDDPKVDGATGAFTQKITLDIPPGRNGLQPDVSLDYNSRRTKESIVGYGWSLSVPYIERENKFGSQSIYATSTYFMSSIDGELAIATSTVTSTVSSSSPSTESNANGPQHNTNCPHTTSVTLSKSVSATSTLLIAQTDPDQSLITSITYAGAALTLATSTGGIATWYLVNPTSGTNNLLINYSASVGGYTSVVSYAGAGAPGAMSHNSGASGDPSISITTNNGSSIVDDNLFYDSTASVTANSPQVQLLTDTCATTHGTSNLLTGTHGSKSLGWTHTGTSADWLEIAVEVLSTITHIDGASATSFDGSC
jgi:Salmonella virulence plasmid 65kDa B protein